MRLDAESCRVSLERQISERRLPYLPGVAMYGGRPTQVNQEHPFAASQNAVLD
jgi:hypothetical protein